MTEIGLNLLHEALKVNTTLKELHLQGQSEFSSNGD